MNFQYQISEDDYLEAYQLFEKYRKNTDEIVMVIFLIAVWVMFFLQANDKKLAIGVACGFGILSTYLTFTGKKTLKSEYAHHAFMKQLIDFTLTDEGCLVISDDSRTFLRWEKIHRYVENDKFWLIYISPHLMHIVPKSAVADSDSKQLSDTLKQHIGERKQ